MPPDRMQKKNNKLCRIFWVTNAEKRRDYAENTTDYAEISAVNKIDNRTFACGVVEKSTDYAEMQMSDALLLQLGWKLYPVKNIC